jgi:hypothetical protein
MEISSEDSLRLNVLLANAKAIRIDENSLCVYGLSASSEARIKLNPTCRTDRYLRYVRELLSSAVLGSPGGYPVYLKRWTRMGQLSHEHLDDLLMLGEPEAVVAVACSPNLTDELANRVWWAMSDAEIARRMLERECVVRGAMGRVLAEFLIEFLPFEEDPLTIIRTVCLLLQPGLLNAEECLRIWHKGRQKNVFLIGFLLAMPDDLPEPGAVHPAAQETDAALRDLRQAANPYAMQLSRCLSSVGQSFLRACQTVLRKPSNQDVVVSLLDAITMYFATVAPPFETPTDIDALTEQIKAWCMGSDCPTALRAVLNIVPNQQSMLVDMMTLACCNRQAVREIFSGTDSIGSLMRTKLAPISKPMLGLLANLLNE